MKFAALYLLSLLGAACCQAQDLAITSALVYASPQKGMRADLTVLSADPATAGPTAFTAVKMTIHSGVIPHYFKKSQLPNNFLRIRR